MANLTQFYRSRVIYDLTDYKQSDFDDRVMLCVPRFAWLQARNLMRGYGLRLNAYAETYVQGGYIPPDVALFDQIDASISDFLSEGDMSCDITAALDSIAAAIIAGQDCDTTCGGKGSFGAGTQDDSEVPFESDGGNWPAGFVDRAEYDTYRCAVANAIMSQMRTDFNWLKTGVVIGIAASALAFTLFTPIPLDDIIALLGFAIALSIEGALVGAATAMVAAIDADEESYVCALYSAIDVAEAKTQLQDVFDADLTTTEALLASYFVRNASMNALFEKSATYEQVDGTLGASCDDCICPSFGTLYTIVSRNETQAILQSEEGTDDDFLYTGVHVLDDDAPAGAGGPWGPFCEAGTPDYTVTLVSGTAPNFYATYDSSGTPIIPVWTTWPGSYTGNATFLFLRRDSRVDRYRMLYVFD